MGDFGARARKFMGWYSVDDIEAEQDFVDSTEEFAPVSSIPAAPAEAPVVPLRRETEMRAVESTPAASVSRVTTVHPTSFADSAIIGDAFREGVTVIINLSEMAEDDARRVIDFAFGLKYGLGGTIERVVGRVFLLSPAEVQVVNSVAPARRDGLFDRS